MAGEVETLSLKISIYTHTIVAIHSNIGGDHNNVRISKVSGYNT